jgi:Tfp pilus assembly protein PilF
MMAVCVHGQSIEDQYLRIYNLIQEGDSLLTDSPNQARLRYSEAQTGLQRFQRVYPDWNPQVVAFRLKYVTERIASAGPATTPAPAPAAGTAGTPASKLAPGPSPELAALQEQVRQLQTDKVQLEGKLREALAARPAMTDPRELARAQDRIKALQKENELLQVSLAQAKERATTPVPVVASPKDEGPQLAAANKMIASLTQERDGLQARVQKQEADAKAMEMLRRENEILKGRVAKLESKDTQSEVAEVRKRSEEKISQLERDKQKLERDLSQARQDLAARSARTSKTKAGQLELQLTTARATIAAYEARAIPFTPEELALFRGTPPALNTNAPATATPREPPAGTTELLAEARRYFATRQLDKAESKYAEVLRKDDRNAITLANLAVIQLEQGRLSEAEKNVRKALTESPNDAFSLLVLGQVQFQQKKFEAAVQSLSRAAQLEPENPEVQNHLGVALSEKGMRVAAEAALRKAVQLRPGYGRAHHNLAVVYVSAKPPSTELAKWHYQKALTAGEPRDPGLERMLGMSSGGRVE